MSIGGNQSKYTGETVASSTSVSHPAAFGPGPGPGPGLNLTPDPSPSYGPVLSMFDHVGHFAVCGCGCRFESSASARRQAVLCCARLRSNAQSND